MGGTMVSNGMGAEIARRGERSNGGREGAAILLGLRGYLRTK
jgi:hypothetical protein